MSLVFIDTKGHQLEEIPAKDFFRMEDAAKADGYGFRINTAHRTREWQAQRYKLYQTALEKWKSEGKLNPEPPLVAEPGTSEHEKGNAIDYDTWEEEDFIIWVAHNSVKYNFYLTARNERWHLAHYPPPGPAVNLKIRHINNLKMILG